MNKKIVAFIIMANLATTTTLAMENQRLLQGQDAQSGDDEWEMVEPDTDQEHNGGDGSGDDEWAVLTPDHRSTAATTGTDTIAKFMAEGQKPETDGTEFHLMYKGMDNVSGLRSIPGIDQATLLCLLCNKIALVPCSFQFPHLQKLDLRDNQLTTFPTGALVGAPALEELDLGHNQLTTLEQNSCEGPRNLRRLDLSHNNFESFPHGPLGLQKLKELNLRHNRFEAVTEGEFEELQELETLDLRYNRLQTLAQGASRGLRSLLWLLLSHNELKTIQDGALQGPQRLEKLSLDHNQFATTRQISLRGVEENLQLLDLAHNPMYELAGNTLQALQRLRWLYCNNNHLHTLAHKALPATESLEVLDLSHNHLRVLVAGILQLPGLLELDISNNCLKSIRGDALQLPALRQLNLSHNNLQTGALAPPRFTRNKIGKFQRLPKLYELYLDNNWLHDLVPGTLKGTGELAYIHLENNPIPRERRQPLRERLRPIFTKFRR